ncbi:MAG: site-2 protease family protein [Armatimonadetes bacterium]|nr:site-2 protease family protein [Armatimonadota bacterium]
MEEPKIEHFLIGLIVLIVSISLHEFGHAISADKLGDPGPRRDGRITLYPGAHLDPMGFIMICVTMWYGFGIGWGKPVMVQPGRFRDPRKGMVITSLCGPLMNLALALAFGLFLRVLMATGQQEAAPLLTRFAGSFLIINLSLMFFNLIPIHPLDGGKILSGMLPISLAEQFDSFMWQWGPVILIVSCFSGAGFIGKVIGPAVDSMIRVILGI